MARDFQDIKNSLSQRGIELDPRRANLVSRIRHITLILVPLIMTSFGRVETIANAMDLRSFGKNRTRTWYRHNPPTPANRRVRLFTLLLAAFCLYYIIQYRILTPYPHDYWAPICHGGVTGND